LQYLDLFIYNLLDLWLEASQAQENQQTYVECYILIKWIYVILELLCQFIFFPH